MQESQSPEWRKKKRRRYRKNVQRKKVVPHPPSIPVQIGDIINMEYGDSIVIKDDMGRDIVIQLVHLGGPVVRLAIEADKSIHILREEVIQKWNSSMEDRPDGKR